MILVMLTVSDVVFNLLLINYLKEELLLIKVANVYIGNIYVALKVVVGGLLGTGLLTGSGSEMHVIGEYT